MRGGDSPRAGINIAGAEISSSGKENIGDTYMKCRMDYFAPTGKFSVRIGTSFPTIPGIKRKKSLTRVNLVTDNKIIRIDNDLFPARSKR